MVNRWSRALLALIAALGVVVISTPTAAGNPGQIVIPADKLPAGQDGWFQHDDGTRQWIDASCRADLEAAGVNVVILDWGDLSAIPDGPQLPCSALMPTTTTTTPATTTTTTAPTTTTTAPTTTTTAPPGDTPRLDAGDRLNAGDKIVSNNGTYRVVMQGDGNLVLYTGSRALWASNTAGHPGAYAVLQGDGNLVVYRNGQALWASDTNGRPGAHATIQNDGNFVIYQNGAARWASDTMQGGSLTFTAIENPFVCDGTLHNLGVFSGARPGEHIDLSSPGISLLDGTANSAGKLTVRWQCNPSEVGDTWTLTARGATSGRVGSVTIRSTSAPSSGGGGGGGAPTPAPGPAPTPNCSSLAYVPNSVEVDFLQPGQSNSYGEWLLLDTTVSFSFTSYQLESLRCSGSKYVEVDVLVRGTQKPPPLLPNPYTGWDVSTSNVPGYYVDTEFSDSASIRNMSIGFPVDSLQPGTLYHVHLVRSAMGVSASSVEVQFNRASWAGENWTPARQYPAWQEQALCAASFNSTPFCVFADKSQAPGYVISNPSLSESVRFFEPRP